MANNTGKQNQTKLSEILSRLVEEEPRENNANNPVLLLDEFIVNISKDIEKEECKKYYEDLTKIYENDFRHSYSRVTEKLISLDTDEEKLIAKFDIILQNIISIKGYINEKLKKIDKKLEEIDKKLEEIDKEKLEEIIKEIEKEKEQIINILKRFNKLEDHINLEYKRFTCISNKYGKEINEIKDKAEKLKTDIEVLSSCKIREIEDKAIKLENDLKNSKINYVTILGIFSAIIIAFTGSIAFPNQVLEIVGEIELSAVFMIISIIAIFIGNIIFALFWFILHLNNRTNSFSLKEPFWIFTSLFNVIFIIIFGLSTCSYNSSKKIANDKILENNQTNVIDLNNTKTK